MNEMKNGGGGNAIKNRGSALPQAPPQFNLHPFPSAKVTFFIEKSKFLCKKVF
jgi:hypothetical protein